ncbi:pentapeptide repeat-containing protein [Fortiea sp. LEGE XX443]|uniref:pentapeptide repeat-containing protein n=1 Tax=Fortiea sp. LEGE XX443 TaxID=1828611 RepID=UPI001882C40C|nr:pentapeptide repeat-containing protein [Fortiea sp. LEGE XX443]MBE9006901.1 pentapeptide repeat-containing protein [Fortiea sp. LEGE XX443]
MPPDYSGQNLRGRSFKGQNLTGANFSKADIRGANFTNAILKEADFTGAKAGLQQHWTIGLHIISWLLSGIYGFWSDFLGISVPSISANKVTEDFILGIAFSIGVLLFCIITIRKSLTAALGAIALAFSLLILVIILAVGAGSLVFKAEAGFSEYIQAMVSFLTKTTAFNTIATFCGALTFAGVAALFLAFAGALTGALAEFRALAGIVAIAGILAGVRDLANLVALAKAEGLVIDINIMVMIFSFFALDLAKTVVEVVVFTLFSTYIGWRSLARKNGKDSWLGSFIIAFAATGGTSFRGADLTDAEFTGAILKNTDFRKANLTRTRFYEAKKLDFARLADTILINRDILNLLVSCNGRGKSYLGANLKGANLMGADLKEANFKYADITEATFQGACLEWSNLTLAQAVGTSFTSAQMTGACVEAWNIESTTKLDNVDCRFIYLLENSKPQTDDRERRPSSGDFQPGEFTKLFEEVLNTVDLIFRNGIDWKAFVATFKKVQEDNEDTDLSIQSIANKGDGVVVVKVNVPDSADKEKIHSDFMQNYQIALQAVEEKYKAQLQAKDNEIVIYRQQSADMKEIIGLLANKPVNVQVDNKVENKNMPNGNDSSRNFNIGNIAGDFNNSGTINLGEISGTVTNTINQLPPSPEPDKPGIRELLEQLKAAIDAEKDLTDEDKAEALEQVQALAEAGKNPQEGAMQKAAKTAVKILKGTIASLPTTATLVEAGSKLLPLISKLFGLG